MFYDELKYDGKGIVYGALRRFALNFLPLAVFSCSCLTAQTQENPQNSNAGAPNITTLAPPAQNAHLSELEWLLTRVVLKYQPEARLEVRNDRLIFVYRDAKLANHLTTDSTSFWWQQIENSGADSPLFLLCVSLEKDTLTVVGAGPRGIRIQERFVTRLYNRYNLRSQHTLASTGSSVARIRLIQSAAEYPDVPRGSWAYEVWQKLSHQNLFPEQPLNGARNKTVTRYEFAVMTARLMFAIEQAKKSINPPLLNPPGPGTIFAQEHGLTPQQFVELSEKEENKDLIEGMKDEFTPELIRLGVLPKPKDAEQQNKHYEYLRLSFFYGHGVNPLFVDEVKALLSDYSTASLKQNQPE